MNRRDVAALILILLLGAFVTTAQKFRHGVLPANVRIEGLEFLQGPLHTFSESAEEELAPRGRVTVEAGRGDVQVQTWSEAKVRVELKKQIRMEDEKEAARLAGELKLEMLPGPEGLVIRPAGKRPTGASTEFTVMVPEQSRLQVITDNGSVVIRGVKGDVLVKTAHGDVEVVDVGGAVEVVNDDGSVELHRIQGEALIRTAHGDVRGSDLAGTAEVDCEDGDVELSRVTGAVKVAHAHGEVQVSEAGGDVHVTSSNADVELTGVRGMIDLVNEHGSVRVERAGADVRVTAPHCEITVETVEGSLTATVQGDPLTAGTVKGGVKIQASAGSVTLTDVQGPIVVAATHTPVEIVRPGSDVEVNTTNQGIVVASPAGQGFRLDARADQGEVESNLPALHVSDDRPSHFAGSVGDGRLRYRLNTSHSTISIRASELQREEPDEGD